VKETESKTKNERSSCRNVGKTPATRTQLSRSRAKDKAKKPWHIVYLKKLEEEAAAAAVEEKESVRPSTTLGRPKGQTSLAH